MLQSLRSINNLTDPLKHFLCNFTIMDPPGAPFAQAGVENIDLIALRAQSFDFPSITGDKTEVWWGGHHRTFAGKQTRHGDWTVKFTEMYTGNVYDGFKNWMNRYHNFLNGTISILDEYRTTVRVALLNPQLYDPAVTATEKWIELHHVIPVAIAAPDSIDPSGSEPVDLTVTFHYNYFLMGDEVERAQTT